MTDKPENILHLVPPTDPCGVVETLEHLLTRAKAGEFVSVDVVCHRTDAGFEVNFSGFPDALQKLGGLVMLLLDTYNHMQKTHGAD